MTRYRIPQITFWSRRAESRALLQLNMPHHYKSTHTLVLSTTKSNASTSFLLAKPLLRGVLSKGHIGGTPSRLLVVKPRCTPVRSTSQNQAERDAYGVSNDPSGSDLRSNLFFVQTRANDRAHEEEHANEHEQVQHQLLVRGRA